MGWVILRTITLGKKYKLQLGNRHRMERPSHMLPPPCSLISTNRKSPQWKTPPPGLACRVLTRVEPDWMVAGH